MRHTKAYYRNYFVTVYHYVKLSVILNEHGEKHQNLSKFIKSNHYDHYLSIDKCQLYENWIKEAIKRIT